MLTSVPLHACTTVCVFVFLVAGSGLLPVLATAEAAGTALVHLSPGARVHSSRATCQLHRQIHSTGPIGLGRIVKWVFLIVRETDKEFCKVVDRFDAHRKCRRVSVASPSLQHLTERVYFILAAPVGAKSSRTVPEPPCRLLHFSMRGPGLPPGIPCELCVACERPAPSQESAPPPTAGWLHDFITYGGGRGGGLATCCGCACTCTCRDHFKP